MNNIKATPLTPQDFVVEQISENEANIIAYPFETGYAVSLAHPLRRFLLSSSVGYAPVAVKIEGAKHEFDSVRGMLEDISDFIINLKGIRFKLNHDNTEAEVNYSFVGPCEIKGKDLENEDVSIVTPESFLATLNEDATLNFTIKIYQGIGYVPSEDIRDEFSDDYIVLDAFFTPVKRATYKIEKMLVDDNPNFERVILNILTDGQVSPLDAFRNSLNVMHSQSARSYNCLNRSDIKMIGEIVLMSENDLKNVKNLGKKSFEEILEKVEEFGFAVGYDLSTELKNALIKKIEAQ